MAARRTVDHLPVDEAEEILTRAQDDERQGRVEQAFGLYRRFIELRPEDPRGPNKLGALTALLGRYDEARALFEEALVLDPKFVPAITNLGNIHLERGEAEAAMRRYEEALELDANYAPAHHNMAAALKRVGQIAPMVRHLKDAQRASREAERKNVRKEMAGCFARGGKATVLLIAAGILPLAAFWH